MKKNTMILNLLGVVLCGLATPAAADFCGQNYNNCCEWSACDGKMTFGADWLYWKVQQDGILPGAIITRNDFEETPTILSTSAVRPNFKYDSGFRVNLGYELPGDSWDVNVAYTYMPSHAKTLTFVAPSDLVSFSPINSTGDLRGAFNGFEGKWNTTINNIDLDIGRTVCFGECLNVRPHIGFRANWFDQKYSQLASNVEVDPETQLSTRNLQATSVKEKFQGYGVEGGLWADYKLGYGVSLVGHVGGSILYSKYTVTGVSTATFIDEDGVVTINRINNASDKIWIGTPSVDYFVGLKYADNFCDMLVQAHIGWEQHVMFDTNRYLSSGNLSAQGLTLGLEVGF